MYAIELPKELLARLARLHDQNRKPIARQVREAVKEYCEREDARAVTYCQGAGYWPCSCGANDAGTTKRVCA